MTDSSKAGRIGRLAIEFSVIVLGVFVALAGESWWADREERAFERELRDDMLLEFAGNIAILEDDLTFNQTATRRVADFAALSEAELMALSDDAFNEDYATFPSWAGFDPEMGIVQALVQSGNLGAIDDRTLRLRLSRWAGLLAEKDRFTLQASNFMLNSMIVVLSEAGGDRNWSTEERRQVQSLYSFLSELQVLVVANQRRLLDEAQAISDYLSDDKPDAVADPG